MYRSRKPATKSRVYDSVVSAELMWAVAVYANRVNGEYLNGAVRDPETGQVMRERNIDIMRNQLKLGLIDVTTEDLQQGQQAKAWHQGRITLKLLRGEALSDFERALLGVLEQEEFWDRGHRLETAILASQINNWIKGVKQDALMEGIDHTPLAGIGERVKATATVVRSVFSMNYNVFFITAHTVCNKLIFFSYRNDMKEGDVIELQGTVKSHRTDRTQLNRVKVFK